MATIATAYRTAAPDNVIRAHAEAMVELSLSTGELVTAERIDVGKPAPGKFAAPVDVSVTIKTAG